MYTAIRNIYRDRVGFQKINTSIPIPNLIEIQKNSYERFLQMRVLPAEREDAGLQSVFKSVFPITDLRENCSLEFVDYAIGNWECKCGRLVGLDKLGRPCTFCGATLITDPRGDREIHCGKCGHLNENTPVACDTCDESVGLKLKYDVDECQERGMTFAVPLKVTIRLVVWDKDPETGAKTIRDIKEQEVYFGDIPLMTENGTFIINGTERVIVSQLHRSPGVFFERVPAQGYFLGKIIPYRGSWVEFEYDTKNLLYVRIDRKRKFYGSVFLRALGLATDEQILKTFYRVDKIAIKDKKLYWQVSDGLLGMKLSHTITKGGETVVGQGKKITSSLMKEIQKHKISQVEVAPNDLEGAFVAADVVDMSTGEVLVDANAELTTTIVAKLLEAGIDSFEVFFPERDDVGTVISATIKKDPIKARNDALIEIYRKLRPGDPPTLDTASQLFQGMFFDPRKYDFSRVGRMKFNIKLHDKADYTPLDKRTLDANDFYDTIRYLLKLRRGIGAVDDIDHLGNRRVRAVGELLENQFRIGLVRMERAIKEKMSVYQEMSTAMPHDLVNAKPVMAAIREFFGSSQLSQFMDQTNPLSEITHKRRLSALGPGGLSRERAGFEVRDVHPTHYGRICPIETPEGPNIGLISSLSCFARTNEFGFIETPYRKVTDGRVVEYVRIINGGDTKFKPGEHVPSEEVAKANKRVGAGGRKADSEPWPFYLTAWEEDKHVVGQANIELDETGYIINERNAARKAGEFILALRKDIEYVDVSPKQLVSVAASLIPFLENDDANRALMGSNMQRQSVPLLRAEAPYIGTGMEDVTARDSGAVVIARRDGVVDYTDSERIIVKADHNVDGTISREVTADIYTLIKFKRSNQNTCINQRPIVHVGERVAKGQVIADGPCTDRGELALGRNVLVAFMPWRGYNFEDAILVSERLVKEDYYTSIHIEELEIEARDTKLGHEEITRDIPNVGENMLRDLDESGIIRIGAAVKPGSILVGKVTPKGETQLTAEEKLLRAIFGEKAADVKDASLVSPPGIDGTVVDVQVFTRKGQEKDQRSMSIEEEEEERLRRDLEDEIRILHEQRNERIYELFEGRKLAQDLTVNREVVIPKGAPITREMLQGIEPKALRKAEVAGSRVDAASEVKEYEDRTERQIKILSDIYEEKIAKLRQGDELSPGVIKMVKVFIAMKRKLSVGDKMAGRHGNKGVIARILPEEDMPYLPDGTPVEIVLNPLGVPSRMNVGQILETHLGWAAHALGLYFATPVFDGATEIEIKNWLDRAGLPKGGKTRLYDGMSGDAFEQDVTVGYIYMLKLSHLVDDKIHARSIGPYSLITQQPLGGKAQFGGQRFGEMEVWALEAYGSAHILQEL